MLASIHITVHIHTTLMHVHKTLVHVLYTTIYIAHVFNYSIIRLYN